MSSCLAGMRASLHVRLFGMSRHFPWGPAIFLVRLPAALRFPCCVSLCMCLHVCLQHFFAACANRCAHSLLSCSNTSGPQVAFALAASGPCARPQSDATGSSTPRASRTATVHTTPRWELHFFPAHICSTRSLESSSCPWLQRRPAPCAHQSMVAPTLWCVHNALRDVSGWLCLPSLPVHAAQAGPAPMQGCNTQCLRLALTGFLGGVCGRREGGDPHGKSAVRGLHTQDARSMGPRFPAQGGHPIPWSLG